mmetsp:Transcript_15036/g.32788  ORF Transcript_15036/g.32788 Transcript_15036/m.32788 type:complete len:203 (+) Transcript_15036:603-1211(+)
MNFEAGRYTKGWFMFGRAKHPNPPRQLFGPAVTSPKYSPPTPMIPSQNVLLQEASILVTWQLSHQDRSKRQWIVAFERMRGARPCQREEDCFGVREPPIRVGREVLGWPSPCVGNLFAVGPGKPFIASFFWPRRVCRPRTGRAWVSLTIWYLPRLPRRLLAGRILQVAATKMTLFSHCALPLGAWLSRLTFPLWMSGIRLRM